MTAKPYHRSCVPRGHGECTNREPTPWLASWIEGFLYVGARVVELRTLRQLSVPTPTASWVVDTVERLGGLVVTLDEILCSATIASRERGHMADSIDLDRHGIRPFSWPSDRAPRSRVDGVLAQHQPAVIAAVANAVSDYATHRDAIERLVDVLLRDAVAPLHRRLQRTEAAQPTWGVVTGPPTRGTYPGAWQFRRLITVLEVLAGILGRPR